jgi:dTDP-glucose 4,6-dehydratase
MKNILITGGSGFIGSNFINYIFSLENFHSIIINIDKLTYAGNPENLQKISNKFLNSRYFFEKIDIVNFERLEQVFLKYKPDIIVHFAAESHVDRSILGPREFINTNIIGTFNLLECARKHWVDYKGKLFHHVSTDEVYGSLNDEGFFFENTAYDPHSPYSASKASSDHLVNSYYHTYNLPVTMSNCSNNYGPLQFPEKLIPLMINNMLKGRPLPVYGRGLNVRDWLYVEDHCRAIYKIIQKGKCGETYNIGGENEIRNIDIVNILCEKMAKIKDKNRDYYKKLITSVKDRPGHDWRYAINMDKIKNKLNFKLSVTFEEGIMKTIQWYLDNPDWIENIESGEYRNWIETNYNKRQEII